MKKNHKAKAKQPARVAKPASNAKLAKRGKTAKVVKPIAAKTKPAKTPAPEPVLSKPPQGTQVLPADLMRAFDGVRRAAARRSTLPVLGTFHIVADAGTQRLQVTATNLELAVWRHMPAAVNEPWALCVPYEISDLARHLPDQPLALTVEPEHATILLEQPGFRASFNGIPAEEYPVVAKGGNALATIEFTREQLAEIVARVLPCAATDEARPVLTAVFVNVHPGRGHTRQVDFAAADGFRLAKVVQTLPVKLAQPIPAPKSNGKRKKPTSLLTSSEDVAPEAKAEQPAQPAKPSYEFSTLVPTVFFVEALKIADDDHALVVEVCGSHVTCANDKGGVTCHTLDGTAPDYTRIIPSSESMRTIPLPLQALGSAMALARVYAASSMHTLRLLRSEDGLVVKALSATLGEFAQAIPVAFGDRAPDEGFETGVNIRYFNQALAAATWNAEDLDTQPVELHVQTPATPLLIERGAFTTVIMPMHLGDSKPKSKEKKEVKEEPAQAVCAEPSAAKVEDDGDQVVTVACGKCQAPNDVRAGNSAVCACGAIVDDQGCVIFDPNAEPVAV